MQYVSTRGLIEPVGFQDAVLMGLARDGGLLVPTEVPDVRARLATWRGLPYGDLAFEILSLFADLPPANLKDLIARSYATFRHPEVTPVVDVGDFHVLELFHGPTLAFKDVALQLLGRLFAHVLDRTGGQMNILAATSGDTGSAAISGVRGLERIRIFVMHPHGRVSRLQELQMTSVLDANVFNIAVQGTFDDCQAILKTLFGDLEFRDRHALGSVNSINWARLLAQMVYYFYAAFRVMDRTGADRVRFAVPTGNFGDIFAGWMAARMGLPISRLILATNENDILARFFRNGDYSLGHVVPTLSPSMDIQVASNFERYLYYRCGEDASAVRETMQGLTRHGRILAEPSVDGTIDPLICAGSGNTDDTLRAIRECHERWGYLLDPHTAVGVHVGRGFAVRGEPLICLATAHPAKFPNAVQRATGQDLAHHPLLDALEGAPSRCEVLPNSADAVRRYLDARLAGRGA